MKTHRHLFLDLEDTVITPVLNGWGNVDVINVEKIKSVIQSFNPDKIHLFSFAIWNAAQLNLFRKRGACEMVERALDIKFSTTWTVNDDILPACLKLKNINTNTVDFSEMCAFWGKHEAFRLNMRHHFGNVYKNSHIRTEVMLLDDSVWGEKWEWPDLQITGRIINIDKLE